MGGPYRDPGGDVRGALEDQGALPTCKEGGDPVEHAGGYISGKEEGSQLGRIYIVEAGFYVEKEGGYL